MGEKKFKLSIWSFVILATAVAVVFAALYQIRKTTPIDVPSEQGNAPKDFTATSTASRPVQNSPAPKPAPAAPPPVLNLPIPFTSQAPTANWDELHNEACEEASAIMANAYLAGDRDAGLPATRVEAEISSLTVWQDQHFGYHLNTTARETAEMIEGAYGLKATVQNDYTLQDIKDQLNLRHVVILPVNGRVIGNPNYRQPGPIYHMLVVRGYTSTGLVTDDSGTRRGQNYPYTFDTLHNAGADWDHSTNTIDQTKKVMIIVSK